MTEFNIASLKTDAGTQFRTQLSKSQVEGMSDLIERNVKWKTPIQIASFDNTYYLTDGFHRVEAYRSMGIVEIPTGQFEIIECETMDEVFMLSIRGNAAHGNKNTVEERLLMMHKLIQMDEKRFMSNRWEVSLTAIAEALQIPKGQARTVVQPKNEALKQERNAEINRLHKEGKSNGEVDSLLDLGKDYTRRFLLKQGQVSDTREVAIHEQVMAIEPLNAAATSGGVQNDMSVIFARKDAEIAKLQLNVVVNTGYAAVTAQLERLVHLLALEGVPKDDLKLLRDWGAPPPKTKEEATEKEARRAEVFRRNAETAAAVSMGLAGMPPMPSSSDLDVGLQTLQGALDTYRDAIAKAIANKGAA